MLRLAVLILLSAISADSTEVFSEELSSDEGEYQAMLTALESTPENLNKRVDALEAVYTGLDILGTVSSLPLLSILTSMLKLFFPPGADTQRLIEAEILGERGKQQCQDLAGFKESMRKIVARYNISADGADEDMRDLERQFHYRRCHFMYYDSVSNGKSFPFIKDFATMHLIVVQTLISKYPERHYSSELVSLVTDYVRYAQFAIQREAAEHRDIREEMETAMGKWMEQVPEENRRKLNEQGLIKNGMGVSFKVTPRGDKWLSCFTLLCDTRSCPGEDNPMNPKCKSEKFKIYAIDETDDGVIRTCSRVGIYYSMKNGKYLWLSKNSDRKTCPGASATSMRNGQCDWEAWTIYQYGEQKCGVPIRNRDVIILYNGSRSVLDSSALKRVYFVMHRWDIAQSAYFDDMPCRL